MTSNYYHVKTNFIQFSKNNIFLFTKMYKCIQIVVNVNGYNLLL